jgi:hypothetical protein
MKEPHRSLFGYARFAVWFTLALWLALAVEAFL